MTTRFFDQEIVEKIDFSGSSDVPTRFFDPKIVEQIDFAVRERYQVDFLTRKSSKRFYRKFLRFERSAKVFFGGGQTV